MKIMLRASAAVTLLLLLAGFSSLPTASSSALLPDVASAPVDNLHHYEDFEEGDEEEIELTKFWVSTRSITYEFVGELSDYLVHGFRTSSLLPVDRLLAVRLQATPIADDSDDIVVYEITGTLGIDSSGSAGSVGDGGIDDQLLRKTANVAAGAVKLPPTTSSDLVRSLQQRLLLVDRDESNNYDEQWSASTTGGKFPSSIIQVEMQHRDSHDGSDAAATSAATASALPPPTTTAVTTTTVTEQDSDDFSSSAYALRDTPFKAAAESARARKIVAVEVPLTKFRVVTAGDDSPSLGALEDYLLSGFERSFAKTTISVDAVPLYARKADVDVAAEETTNYSNGHSDATNTYAFEVIGAVLLHMEAGAESDGAAPSFIRVDPSETASDDVQSIQKSLLVDQFFETGPGGGPGSVISSSIASIQMVENRVDGYAAAGAPTTNSGAESPTTHLPWRNALFVTGAVLAEILILVFDSALTVFLIASASALYALICCRRNKERSAARNPHPKKSDSKLLDGVYDDDHQILKNTTPLLSDYHHAESTSGGGEDESVAEMKILIV